MKFEIEDDGKSVKLHIYFTGLTPKQIVEALRAPYDEAIMDELINSSQFPLKERREYERKSFIGKRIFRGRLVILGAYEIYLANRESFLKRESEEK